MKRRWREILDDKNNSLNQEGRESPCKCDNVSWQKERSENYRGDQPTLNISALFPENLSGLNAAQNPQLFQHTVLQICELKGDVSCQLADAISLAAAREKKVKPTRRKAMPVCMDIQYVCVFALLISQIIHVFIFCTHMQWPTHQLTAARCWIGPCVKQTTYMFLCLPSNV